jgi:hypothetical protein
MPEIRFTIDDETYRVQQDVVDPNALYTSTEAIKERVEEAGYTFEDGDVPDKAELSLAGRDTSGSDVELGDITDRVTEQGDSESTESGGDGETPPTPSDGREITIELIGPDGQRESKSVTDDQNLGAVTSALSLSEESIGMGDEVKLYQSQDRRHEIDRGEMASEFDGETLYWRTEKI